MLNFENEFLILKNLYNLIPLYFFYLHIDVKIILKLLFIFVNESDDFILQKFFPGIVGTFGIYFERFLSEYLFNNVQFLWKYYHRLLLNRILLLFTYIFCF